MILYLLFLIAAVVSAGAVTYVRWTGTGRAGRTLVVAVAGAVALISYVICREMCHVGLSMPAYALLSAGLVALVWLLADRLLKPCLSANGIFPVARNVLLFATAGIAVLCPLFARLLDMPVDCSPGAGDMAAVRYVDSGEVFYGEDCGDEVFVMPDSIGCDGFYDEDTVVAQVDPAGTYGGEAEDEADEYSAFAPGISDWSNCELFFLADAGGFRAVNFFIHDGDRCIRVTRSPATLWDTYAYVNTVDGVHRFKQYTLTVKPDKWEMTDVFGNPMTINVPPLWGLSTKYEKTYADRYVLLSEDASEFVDDGKSYSSIGKDAFWAAWKSRFGENWHLATWGGGRASAGVQGVESSSDYGIKKCKYCGGSGYCSTCGGRGNVNFMGDLQDCPSCRGFKRCFNCGGSGIQI